MSVEPSTPNIRSMVYASLFAALIAVGAFLAIPIGPVPIALQSFFVMLAGLALGPRWGLAAILTYLLAGAVGLPVFAGGTGGIGRFLGPTGGFLFGYIPFVWLIGAISWKCGYRLVFNVLALLAGEAALYLLGVAWLQHITGMAWGKALAVGLYPFAIGDAIKIMAALGVARFIRPVVQAGNAGR